MKKLALSLQTIAVLLSLTIASLADVTIKQRVTMSGQKFESTRRIKGSRERTEQRMELDDPAAAAYLPQIATVTQCDLKRRIQINDRNRLYLVDPFDTGDTPTPGARPSAPLSNGATRRGGTLTMSYSVRDTGERKTMFGLPARHLITTQEMETSPDSCNGPHKTKMEIDGWYVDFNIDFSCPTTSAPSMPGGRMSKPDCLDRIVTRGTGTAPRGIMLEGAMKMYGADGSVQMTQQTETLELNRDTLDAALFDIPQGYRQASSSQDLYAISMPTFGGGETRSNSSRPSVNPMMPPVGAKSVALNVAMGNAASPAQSEIESYVRTKLAGRGFRVVSGSADYTVNVQFRQIKESTAGKIGGMFGKITGANTGGVGKVDIDLSATMSGRSTSEAKVKDKFDGPLSTAVRMAIDQAIDQLLSNIN